MKLFMRFKISSFECLFKLIDMVADIVSAKQGYPNMGMSACFGGPLFSTY